MDALAANLIGLIALVAMEIVLGIDNIVFITILSSRLPVNQQKLGRRLGLLMALASRILLLFTLKFILGLTVPLFSWTDDVGLPESWFMERHAGVSMLEHVEEPDEAADSPNAGGEELEEQDKAPEKIDKEFAEVSIRDLILFAGGLFLIAKSVFEIHEKINEGDHDEANGGKKRSLFSVVAQIAVIDIVFSLDSVITAVGMVDQLWIMVVAVIAAVVVMLIFSEMVAKFVEEHPTLKMLALSFLILIGVMLVAESLGAHLDKGYIYFAMAFALIVEFLNIKVRGPRTTSTETETATES